MPTKHLLLRKEITYSEAKVSYDNVVHELSYRDEQVKFYNHIYRHRDVIATLVAHHLSLCPSACQVEESTEWMRGSFNLCVPVKVNTLQRVAIRFPLPYRVGDKFRPGNAYEKNLPLFTRLMQSLKLKFRSLDRLPLPSQLVQHPTTISNKLGPYLLIQFIEETDGRMLSDDWHEKYNGNKELRMNLFRNLAKVFLSLSRKPLPKIGSFTIDNDGFLRLANRPLAVESTIVENEKIPLGIPRDHCVTQMSALSMMRALSERFFERNLNHSPFYLGLADLHASNIPVDEDWNITYLIDLEWAVSRPLEFMQPPYWLTGETVDEISTDKYSERHKEFMEMFEEQENEIHPAHHSTRCSSVMKRAWDIGAFWYILALQSPSGLSTLFYNHIQPQFTEAGMDRVQFYLTTYRHWTHDAVTFLRAQIEEKKKYNEQLQQEFGVEDKELNGKLDNSLDRFKCLEPALGSLDCCC